MDYVVWLHYQNLMKDVHCYTRAIHLHNLRNRIQSLLQDEASPSHGYNGQEIQRSFHTNVDNIGFVELEVFFNKISVTDLSSASYAAFISRWCFSNSCIRFSNSIFFILASSFYITFTKHFI